MIEAATVTVKTMADNTLRLTVDIEPGSAQQAFALFGTRGSPVVIARLTPQAATASARAATISADTVSTPEPQKPKGGDLSRLAGMWCESREFRDWLCQEFGINDISPAEAANFIRSECDITSRADLDHDPQAAETFHTMFRKPFLEWQR